MNKELIEKVEEGKKYAADNIEQLKAYYGDQLLDAIKQNTGYSSIEAYQEYIYISYLQNLAIEDYCKDQITEKEIKKYYEKEIVGDIQVSHILITADVTDDMTDEEKKNAETEAKDKKENTQKKISIATIFLRLFLIHVSSFSLPVRKRYAKSVVIISAFSVII